MGKTEFNALSKSDKSLWTVQRDEIIAKFNRWADDNGEAQPKRGFLVKRLESLGYTCRKSNGSVVFDTIQFLDRQNDDD